MTELTPEQQAKQFIETAIAKYSDRDPGLYGSYSAIVELIRESEERGRQAERQRCIKIAENPYGDEVQAYAGDEPKAVGLKIARTIEGRG